MHFDKKAKRHIMQFIKFGIVGIFNTTIALSVYYVLIWGNINYLVANTVAWVISVFNSFYWNRKYVFEYQLCWSKTLLKTYCSYGVSFIVSSVFLYILVDIAEMSAKIAPLLILIISIPLNFLMNKFWTFR